MRAIDTHAPIAVTFLPSFQAIVKLFQGHIRDVIAGIATCLVDDFYKLVKERKGTLKGFVGGNDDDLRLTKRSGFVSFAYKVSERVIA